MTNNIYVTKTFLPPIEEYEKYIKQIWGEGMLTNQGPLVKKLESEVEAYLQVENFHFVANGTLAIQLALNTLGITEGEVITTPFSYVATTSAILWERCDPVYVDIDKDTLCIDPKKIEAAITNKTKAILAVHVFGNPCDVDAIEEIAKKHELKVIYDAAHSFGIRYKNESIFKRGDISICSFHATKLFHTVEGGGLFVKSKELSDKVELAKRFGHNSDQHTTLGINAKASEFHAAMGLVNLNYIDDIVNNRAATIKLYKDLLNEHIEYQTISDQTEYNSSYFPIILGSNKTTNSVIASLESNNIYPRRYFYPSLNKLPYTAKYNYSCPISESISTRILCLPLYYCMTTEDIARICEIVNETTKKA